MAYVHHLLDAYGGFRTERTPIVSDIRRRNLRGTKAKNAAKIFDNIENRPAPIGRACVGACGAWDARRPSGDSRSSRRRLGTGLEITNCFVLRRRGIVILLLCVIIAAEYRCDGSPILALALPPLPPLPPSQEASRPLSSESPDAWESGRIARGDRQPSPPIFGTHRTEHSAGWYGLSIIAHAHRACPSHSAHRSVWSRLSRPSEAHRTSHIACWHQLSSLLQTAALLCPSIATSQLPTPPT